MANRWSVEEEASLAQVWVTVHEDAINHNAMSFWQRVVGIFNDLSGGVIRNREMVTSKWGSLNCECIVFNGIYRQLQQTTGDDHTVCVTNAMRTFENRYRGKSFKYVHAWEILRNHPRWAE